uniref:Uncharacterized protein n=1 Tax=Mycena chlorophos TaxID=658473 RepID=A0ABQ0L413_MYCCL|nr:predicted protein [Mycena chlorophos]
MRLPSTSRTRQQLIDGSTLAARTFDRRSRCRCRRLSPPAGWPHAPGFQTSPTHHLSQECRRYGDNNPIGRNLPVHLPVPRSLLRCCKRAACTNSFHSARVILSWICPHRRSVRQAPLRAEEVECRGWVGSVFTIAFGGRGILPLALSPSPIVLGERVVSLCCGETALRDIQSTGLDPAIPCQWMPDHTPSIALVWAALAAVRT